MAPRPEPLTVVGAGALECPGHGCRCSRPPFESGLTVNCSNLNSERVQHDVVRLLPRNTKILFLERDKLERLPGPIGSQLALHALKLGGNQIEYISRGAFRSQQALVSLDLSNNNLRTLPDMAFQGLASVYDIALDRNRFQYIPINSLTYLTSMRRLDLDYNRISSVHNNLSKLKTINFL
ncbi:PREDICTED: leucine-rich repeat-containing G-protein coupled receptor 5-like [Branchiostoma belcheri]|uniref:Leucine-rich repeat-containing G-protein coupled receptor 5-like n=1 Tax=Branchiostoma belcheri TaxID=7741 RepID=A0A6P4YV62_BRABE|nr:PREDICTED: leucine-rich repeat-containing G-protein coupled receptor 5-like [Branchiostoma belcheri]